MAQGQQAKLTKGQRAMLEAVANGRGTIFHKVIAEALERMGLIHWIGGMRLIGCNSFAANRFVLTNAGEVLFTKAA